MNTAATAPPNAGSAPPAKSCFAPGVTSAALASVSPPACTAASDSVRRSRQVPLHRPLADFAGSYASDAFGTVTFSESAGGLRFRWGVLSGVAEVYDAEKNQLRIEIAGSGNVVTFGFDGAGKASEVDIGGAQFRRR